MDLDVRGELDKLWKEIEELKKTKNESVNKPTSKGISIKEFLIEKNSSKDNHRALVICYYLEKYKEMESFNAKDIEDGFREAKEKIPDNINYKVIQNIKNGYIMEAKEKKEKLKAWVLTNTGEKFVENNFSKSSKNDTNS